MKSVNVTLPEDLYSEIREFAQSRNVPTTVVVRQAVDSWLRSQKLESRKRAIAEYARDMAGTASDLDPDLEAAGVEHLLQTTAPFK